MQIKVKNLSHTFNIKTPWEYRALKDISCEFADGEYVGVIGSTGSGKTTLIQHLNGLLQATLGEVEWIYQDEVYNKKTKSKEKIMVDAVYPRPKKYGFFKPRLKEIKSIRKKIGVAFQFAEYQLFKGTIREDIAFGLIAYGTSKEQAYAKAEEVIELVGLTKEFLDRSPFELSGGQKRRVALAGILAMDPDYLIVDEPTAGLDPQGVVEILDILTKLHDQGKTIINVTHDLDNILERAKRVILLQDGKIVLNDTPYNVLNNVELLKENNLQPPKILEFVHELRQKGIEVPEVHSLEQLAEFLNTNHTLGGQHE